MPTNPPMTAEQRADDPSIRLSEPTYRIMEVARTESIKPAERFQRIADTISGLIREAERAAVRKCYCKDTYSATPNPNGYCRVRLPLVLEWFGDDATASAFIESEIDRILQKEQG